MDITTKTSAINVATDLVKTRFQNPHMRKQYTNTLNAFYKIYTTEGGIRGLYRGAYPTMARAAALNAAQLSSYDHFKRFLLRHNLMQDNSYCHVVSALFSGLVTTIVTNRKITNTAFQRKFQTLSKNNKNNSF